MQQIHMSSNFEISKYEMMKLYPTDAALLSSMSIFSMFFLILIVFILFFSFSFQCARYYIVEEMCGNFAFPSPFCSVISQYTHELLNKIHYR